MITETTARALQILREHRIERPAQFAEFMWPDSPGWRRHWKRGRSSARGVGMYKAAGCYLAKLVRRELVSGGTIYGTRFYLTREGLRELEQFELQQRLLDGAGV